jgi:uncharacterized membrane protein (UPF0127 family)
MEIRVASSGAAVASDVRWARSTVDRARGLIGETSMSPGAAMVFEPAHQIHTFGMKIPLDIVFCDAKWKVLHVVRTMPPRRITKIVWRARFGVELAAGSLPDELNEGQTLLVVP